MLATHGRAPFRSVYGRRRRRRNLSPHGVILRGSSSNLNLLTTLFFGVSGAASVTLGALTLSAQGSVPARGSADITLGAMTAAATGTVPARGALSITLGAITLDAAGTVPVRGEASITLGALVLAATGTVATGQGITGSANITLGALTVSATGTLYASVIAKPSPLGPVLTTRRLASGLRVSPLPPTLTARTYEG